MERSEIDGLVVQNPRKMGYMGVVTLVDYLRTGNVPERIDTGVALVTRDRLDDPEVKELLGVE
jgi:ribose transport system substrate-binding protein